MSIFEAEALKSSHLPKVYSIYRKYTICLNSVFLFSKCYYLKFEVGLLVNRVHDVIGSFLLVLILEIPQEGMMSHSAMHFFVCVLSSE